MIYRRDRKKPYIHMKQPGCRFKCIDGLDGRVLLKDVDEYCPFCTEAWKRDQEERKRILKRRKYCVVHI